MCVRVYVCVCSCVTTWMVTTFKAKKDPAESVQSHDGEILHAFISQYLLATHVQDYTVQK